MKSTKWWRRLYGVFGIAFSALTLIAASSLSLGVASAAGFGTHAPIVWTANGPVQGAAGPGGYQFLGLPYAAPPTGQLRWRPPQPAANWRGVRDATQFAPSCPQPPSLFAPIGPTSEDCLHLNVYTPALGGSFRIARPVLVWLHGGGFVLDGARSYDPTNLAAKGAVVVTVDYRLGALGFLAHPALASRPGGPTGNYGLMDQQAALRWVQNNIRQFGGDPNNVTLAGQSAGGLSVLAQMVSPGGHGLFQRAIVESGSFALNQQPLATAEADGESFASKAGCPDQSAQCLRNLPVDTLVSAFPPFAIPGVVDGQVLPESIGTALASGQFARVSLLNGVNHDEERIFVLGQGLAVNGGTFVPVPPSVTPQNYQQAIASTLGVTDARAASIAQLYPSTAFSMPIIALSAVLSDANFACPALQIDQWTSRRVPTFAYEFDDDTSPPRYAPLGVATHTSELPYLFGLPAAPIQTPLNSAQMQLANSMQAAWTNFAAFGNPSTFGLRWPSFAGFGLDVMLQLPKPQLDSQFAARHHCSFWAAG